MIITKEDSVSNANKILRKTQSAYALLAKLGVTKVMSKLKFLLYVMGENDNTLKLIGLVKKFILSNNLFEKLPFMAAGYISHATPNGVIFPRPLSVWATWKTTFIGCMRLIDKNIGLSCGFVFIATVVQFLPWFDHRNYFIILSQILINLALLSLNDAEKVCELIPETGKICEFIEAATYGLQ